MGEKSTGDRAAVTHEDRSAEDYCGRERCLPQPWMCNVFHIDGSLRDIRVLDVTGDEWIAVLERLRVAADEVEIDHPYPQLDPTHPATADLFRTWADEPEGRGTTFAFRARFDDVWFFALPLDDEEIEFSLWPDGVVDGTGVAAVRRFLTEVATASGRLSVLTAECVTYAPGMPTLMSHDPATGLDFHI
ncbi:hypothetical protein ACIBEA_31085 [Streptomyces sp. NPDC051555]|uniref:hypothetical protein n=1 Tax=Streptomyces sp. NPDC051555 TaxID=3365657 RepID=UPI003793A18B